MAEENDINQPEDKKPEEDIAAEAVFALPSEVRRDVAAEALRGLSSEDREQIARELQLLPPEDR